MQHMSSLLFLSCVIFTKFICLSGQELHNPGTNSAVSASNEKVEMNKREIAPVKRDSENTHKVSHRYLENSLKKVVSDRTVTVPSGDQTDGASQRHPHSHKHLTNNG